MNSLDYGGPIRSLAEVGRALGISKQHVAQIERNALRKLRSALLDVLREEYGDLGDNPHLAALERSARVAKYRARLKRSCA